MNPLSTIKPISDKFINEVCQRLANNKRVRRKLPGWGRVHIDRMLPFICLYRQPKDRTDLGTENLLLGEASYLIALDDDALSESLSLLVNEIASTMVEQFGAFIIIEIWSTPTSNRILNTKQGTYKPIFRIITAESQPIPETIGGLEKALRRISILDRHPAVEITTSTGINPPGIEPIIPTTQANKQQIYVAGLEISPIYLDPEKETLFPLVLRELHTQFSRSLKHLFFSFASLNTTHFPAHYHTFGRRAMVKAVWDADKKLASIGNKFDLLLNVTPVNTETAWLEFKKRDHQKHPDFIYRPLPFEPSQLKRELYNIRLERLEDPALSEVFQEKQIEFDRQISLLLDRNTHLFLPGSLQIFGSSSEELRERATFILEQSASLEKPKIRSPSLNASEFADRAWSEIKHYQEIYPEFDATVEVRDDITGLVVSRGKLLIGSATQIPQSRVDAALQHEVGTHLLTYYNGRAQPFRQLYTGLAGYEELQEGLAVLSEYLAGGLNISRLRILAARVMAVHCLAQGATFVDTYRQLTQQYGLKPRVAFQVTMRVFRGGGFTKDVVYLRGFLGLLEYLEQGGELEPLFIGKINTHHIAVIKELQWREVLHRPPLQPRYLSATDSQKKLYELRSGLNLHELIH